MDSFSRCGSSALNLAFILRGEINSSYCHRSCWLPEMRPEPVSRAPCDVTQSVPVRQFLFHSHTHEHTAAAKLIYFIKSKLLNKNFRFELSENGNCFFFPLARMSLHNDNNVVVLLTYRLTTTHCTALHEN
jgi:hypothetical protein